MTSQHDFPDFDKIRRVHDGTTVHVFDNDVEAAIRRLRRLTLTAGILRELKIRQDNPKASDRRKRKAASGGGRRR